MTIATHPVTETDRRNTLRWLARHWDRRGEVVAGLLLAATVHESLDEPLKDKPCTCGRCLTCTWDAYRWDYDLARGLEHDPDAEIRDPEDIGQGLCYEGARDEIWQRVKGYEDVLLRGHR